MTAIPAKYRSRCGICDEWIEPGDLIVYVDDEPCHERCEDEA